MQNEAFMMNRRGFLAGTASVAALFGMGAMSGCSAPRQANESEAGAGEEEGIGILRESGETVECDFVVVGGGMAGFAAAITAKQEGVDNVVMLEKNASVGGSTLFAEGVFGNGSRMQKEAGYDPYDSEEILKEELDWSKHVADSALFRDYINGSAEYIDWMLDLGVQFDTLLDCGTGRFCMHHYEGGNGTSAIETLHAVAVDEYGLDIRTSMRATALIIEEDGSVSGVQAESEDGSIVDFKAPTVVLATGGAASNEQIMDEYTKLDAGKWRHLGNQGQDGDGMKMAEKTAMGRGKNVCACNMWVTVEGAGPQDNVNFVGGMECTNIWVNQDAKRFVNEDIAWDFFPCNNEIHSQGAAYSLFDQEHVAYFAESGTSCAWSNYSPLGKPIEGLQDDLDMAAQNDVVEFYKADTLEDLAAQMGLDAATLVNTVDEWNAMVEAGKDEAFGKAGQYCFKVLEAPFYGAKLVTSVLNTIGGIRVNREGEVVAPDGTPVGGLYAAGIVASGFSGEVYGMATPGTCQGPAVYLGRLAGKAAARNLEA